MAISLAPVLKDPDARPRGSALTQFASGYSLRTERYRYTPWGEDGKQGTELYDHENDPQELHNLANDSDFASVAEELAQQPRERIETAANKPDGITQIQFENRRRER